MVRPASRALAAAAALLLSLSLSSSPVARAMCAAPQSFLTLVTSLSDAIPKDGALFVRVEEAPSANGPRVPGTGDGNYALPTMTLVQGETRIPVRAVNLRASLFRLEFTQPPEDGDYTLEGFTENGLSIRIGGTLPPAPVAPIVSSAVHDERTTTSEGHRGEERITSWTTRVALVRALPTSVVLAAIRPHGRAGAYQVFERVSGRSTFEDRGTLGGHCGVGFMPGRGRAWHDMRAELVVFDQFGRVSEPSAAFTVR